MHWISLMRSLHFKIFSASVLTTFLYQGTATSINMHIPFFHSCTVHLDIYQSLYLPTDAQ
jgi:hypothetical protein